MEDRDIYQLHMVWEQFAARNYNHEKGPLNSH